MRKGLLWIVLLAVAFNFVACLVVQETNDRLLSKVREVSRPLEAWTQLSAKYRMGMIDEPRDATPPNAALQIFQDL